MPFQSIYPQPLGDLHYPELGREIPWAFGRANCLWDTLMEEHPQYEKYKMYVVSFWAGILFEAPHRLRSLTVSEMIASVEGMIKTRWVMEDLIEEQRIQEAKAMLAPTITETDGGFRLKPEVMDKIKELMEEQRLQEWSQNPICKGLGDRVQGTIDEIPDEYPLPDFVVPSVIQDFLDKREVQQSTDSVAFVVR